ncbi:MULTISPECIES: methyltransferase domain-containing protein [spotted fever group]|uniref:Biotin biosynthesis protein BioC n=1 Tax=Rickettsia tamurae subsp. buchneri TaxID=1462938 RepID=A0A8E0WKF7_9RICK|nr:MULTISPECIES: methyltransferase domain-containing protein [spotted fever group]EER20797.1 ubie_methyltran, UbiE/COQ5 methyltransferase family [Rickettsia endosymbiont of Ixodes scapularis]EER20822.1 ubie_methyltran, UbiE/COQ5 methyltransferase family [Rickettsia endosymbiont of Ixodes scapularis]KDO02148.1 biotin biosynthesis protein BioC [Rickettsia tamurae subsp. buchneri]KDO02189.1 biotin biosynthesis protein BioC [Rickettsia tamurae subsp. buchneri]
MVLIKRKIQTRFDTASNSYDNVANVQKESAHILVTKLYEFDHKFYPETILDLGTGTGYVTEDLLSYYSESSYTLNDIAPNMIKIVQNKFCKLKKFNFYISDMEYGDFQNHDLIISNFALQWVSNLEATLQKFYAQSKIFSFSCLLDGTFKEWQDILKDYGLPTVLKQYPIEKNLVSFLLNFELSNYHFSIKDFQLTFKNAYFFVKYLQNLGAGTSSTTIPLNKIKNLIKNHDQEFSITYKIFFGIMKRL